MATLTSKTMPKRKETFASSLLTWFDAHGRKDLPWQHPLDPYRVWVSEIMLQQTQVKTVLNYFAPFMKSFPTVAALAKAEQDDVLTHWAGLGYYARARNLHHAAKTVVSDFNGKMPDTTTALESLKGIGKSTAAAIASIAYGQSTAILDGNVKRVLARIHAIDTWPGERHTEKHMWTLAQDFMPSTRCGDYTQAIMDLGATLCTRSKPDCLSCPVQAFCRAYATEAVDQHPVSKPSKKLPERSTTMHIIINQHGEVLLYKRPDKGIWGGLWSLPESNTDNALAIPAHISIADSPSQALEQFRHTFSHYHLDITPHINMVSQPHPVEDDKAWIWVPTDAPKVGLPAPVSKIFKTLNTSIL